MSAALLDTIEHLSTQPRNEEEEYQYTSDFLEWFYQYVYRQQGVNLFPILEKITHAPEYACIQEQCLTLLNISYGKNKDNEKIAVQHENMKKWLLDTIRECM
jgi:hypothetical protein